MKIARLGVTPVKGMTHPSLAELELTTGGPRDDRLFCLVDPATRRVLRTVEHDTLMACSASWTAPRLVVRTPVGEAAADVVDGGSLVADYWSRETPLTVVDGPWASLLSRYLGRPVVLCRVRSPQAVVWEGAVSVVSTSTLAEVARRIGAESDDGARFRPTLVVDTGDAPPFVEDTWVGGRLRLGAATIVVTGRMPRCALVDRRPGVGGRDAAVLAALAGDRRAGDGIFLAVYGDVETPGLLRLGDSVEPLD